MTDYFQVFRKKFILRLLIATAFLPACNSSDNTPANASAGSAINTRSLENDDWVSLFDGKRLAGWHSYGKDSVGRAWKVEDSVIHLDASVKKSWQTSGGGDLLTDEEYSNFDLKLEWKIAEAGNSGILFYVHEDPTKFKYTYLSGPEMQLANIEKNEDRKIEKHSVGDLYDLRSSSSAKIVKPAGQWNQAEIKSDRGKLDFFMNNAHILSAILWDDNWQKLIDNSKFKKMSGFGRYKKGRIALQDHGADVWFRNIMIKKL